MLYPNKNEVNEEQDIESKQEYDLNQAEARIAVALGKYSIFSDQGLYFEDGTGSERGKKHRL